METDTFSNTKNDKASTFQMEKGSPASSNQTGPLTNTILIASIAAGIQFGWALQLSLLTPYVQLLGVPHSMASLVWLCGPISGLLVQPIVGFYSDRCTSRFGRRRPYIVSGTVFVIIAVILIGFAADFGYRLGDSLDKPSRPRAVAFFVIGFWILDVANNMLQGPCRALLGDLAAGNQGRTRIANALYSFFMAVGNVLGYAAGSYDKLHTWFSFTQTTACDVYCANLKSCFFISIALLLVLTIVALSIVKETPLTKEELDNDNLEVVGGGGCARVPLIGDVIGAFKELKRPMWMLLLVTALNWVAWFPFLLYDTDWMGKEVYGGEVKKGRMYDMGVRAGALGLMLNSVVLGFMSLGLEPAVRALGNKGVKRVWGAFNYILCIGLALTVLVTKLAISQRKFATTNGVYEPLPPSTGIKAGALTIFAVLGIPLAVTYSIPFALASIYSATSGAGQGLSLGVLNVSIVIPQMIVSATSGPWDALFGGGNLPAFVVGAVAAAISGTLAMIVLPTPSQEAVRSASVTSSFH